MLVENDVPNTRLAMQGTITSLQSEFKREIAQARDEYDRLQSVVEDNKAKIAKALTLASKLKKVMDDTVKRVEDAYWIKIREKEADLIQTIIAELGAGIIGLSDNE
uniref:Uncharacterized protein n=1 Tax=Phytophthora fragariae TaxID=53985 RepID=A0A6A3DV38_9STRA|nr:hypothetical protein PF009_g24297 [Phytophthora fragariae]